jgi:hypothetical protein
LSASETHRPPFRAAQPRWVSQRSTHPTGSLYVFSETSGRFRLAVLVEAISVIVRRDSISQKFPGGWNAFVKSIPNATLCADNEVARIGFMAPNDVESYIKGLERAGFKFQDNGKAVDIAVVDQQRGPTIECDWLEFARLPFGQDGGTVSACWFFDGPRVGIGIHMPGTSFELSTPVGWRFEESFSKKFGFVPAGEEDNGLRFIRQDRGLDVYLDIRTGKEVYVGRVK